VTALPDPIVCLITHRRRLSPDARTTLDEVRALERWLDAAIGCVDVIQIRERDLDARPLFGLTQRVAARAENTCTVVVVNDRADVGRAADAGGVHLPAAGMPVERVRAFGPRGWIVGRSTHTVDDVRRAADADYVLFGTMFPTESKAPDASTQGLDGLKAALAAASRPVLAIGGIDPTNAAACRTLGAGGVAAIGLFLPHGRTPGSRGVIEAARALRDAMAGADRP
jgi:thiamine-phosphate pyrophosphorylase